MKAAPLGEAAAEGDPDASVDAAADGAVDGAVDAAVLALGDAVVPLQAAKTTDKAAANTAPLTDHLFGV